MLRTAGIFTLLLQLSSAGFASVITGGGGSSTPGGSTNQVQYNNGSTFAGSTNFQFNGTSVTVNGNLGFTGTSTNGLVGTITNDAAATGNVGEYVSSTTIQNTNLPANNTWGDILSMSLTAGDWNVWVTGEYENNAAGSPLYSDLGVSVTSGSSNTGLTLGDTYTEIGLISIPTGSNVMGYTGVTVRFSFATTTTVYMKVRAGYGSGSPQIYGRLSARRMR